MSIPKNLTKEHLLLAIKKIDDEGIPNGAQSKFYDVEYNNKKYPPKLIVSYANIFANGSALERDNFPGGKDTACFRLLEENGFTIVPKEDIYQILFNFLFRVHNDPDNLKSSDFSGEFRNLKVQAGFGKGNKANIPWIALLAEDQKVSRGIYPVYLYYKEEHVLILAFGISETNPPDLNWRERDTSIENFFKRGFNTKPMRYGGSYYFTSYKIDPNKNNYGLDRKKINMDIDEMLTEYEDVLKYQSIKSMKEGGLIFDYKTFGAHLTETGLYFEDHIVLRFVTALVTKPFVILTGLSGSGKTKLALAFAKWIAVNSQQICIVPVGADWTNREPLLGYPNMIQKDTYVLPENGTLNLLLSAIRDPENPYFLILDEMNLSHVERYFADFLSCLESGEKISLHPGPENWNQKSIPTSFNLPPNVFIIGTVNIDETTYMFSPKVLDRASVIEFRISEKGMEEFLLKNKVSKLNLLEAKGADMAKSFVQLATEKLSDPIINDSLSRELMNFFIALKRAGAEFGFRTASEIKRFFNIALKIGNWSNDQLMDAIIMQKLLPRLHGSRRKLEPILMILARYCLKNVEKLDLYLKIETDIHNDVAMDDIKYFLSFEKIRRMQQGLIDHSYTSYAEA
ncbi:MAG: DUF3578 domain-containing protein [Chitinophaga sp.]|uniref:MrcB family domain-containing protein n=1 Tax=Chitinophaga sp. TaxID=1869181 RepID=UPI001B106374|nr:DUF3578 domain-containing protein [Chitinophaga sp.]MBO9728985.1 DUF3578 domain-containing protein [Chitinophaga sp.]